MKKAPAQSRGLELPITSRSVEPTKAILARKYVSGKHAQAPRYINLAIMR
jgi:hypothetical protein